MPQPQAIGTTAQIVVKDAVKTAEYYQQVLGFEVLGYFPSKVSSAYVILQRNGVPIHFGGSGQDTLHYNRDLRPGTPDFLIWVPEIEAYYQEVTAKGARIAQEIIQRTYGREFIIEDCDGHWLHVCD